jgi:hypothetical protein
MGRTDLGLTRRSCGDWETVRAMYPHGEAPGSVDRGEEAAGGAIQREAAVLPGRLLTESRQTLHVAPDRSRVGLVLLRQRERLGSRLVRQTEPLRHRHEHAVTCRRDLLGSGPQEHRPIVRGIGVEGLADARQRDVPLVLNRRADVPASETGHMLVPTM